MHINMGASNAVNHTNDCIAYINKLTNFGINGRLTISAGAAGYGNTNYYIDDTRDTGYSALGLDADQGLLQTGASSNMIDYVSTYPDCGSLTCHITNGTNVAGYFCWGGHSALSNDYAINGFVTWSGNSAWYIIRTEESFNGRWEEPTMGNFIEWYSSSAFGGIKYSNTPVGAVSYVDEPLVGATLNSVYFGLWELQKNFAICAWNSRNTPYFQAVGDPFVCK